MTGPNKADTVHGRMIERLDLARCLLEALGRRVTEIAMLRVMRRYSPDELRALLERAS